ncbi:hypothetical protein [Antarcticimicrobium sediminis]|uniref:hypothetical protein n=1 Tax=Antarcticimicrobium sediminis TaxID=2546227 RepID=UPI0014055C27|nr:hypothetical protein [Antarcticimicrobium sediminis]
MSDLVIDALVVIAGALLFRWILIIGMSMQADMIAAPSAVLDDAYWIEIGVKP